VSIDRSQLRTGVAHFGNTGEDDARERREALEELKRVSLDFEGIVFPGLGIDPWSWSGDQVQAECPNPEADHERGGAWGFHTGKMVHSCFGCGYSGDVIGLAQDLLAMDDWREALDWLREGSGQRPGESHAQFIDRVLEGALEASTPVEEAIPDYPADMLFKYDEIHDSVFERGISPEVVREMQIGFDRSHMATTIPHFFRGRLVGVQYRHLAQDAAGEYLCPRDECTAGGRVPKFKNTRPFPRNTTLYNYDNVQEFDSVFAVESPMTVLYLKSHGLPNVVGTFGGFVSPQQAQLLYGFPEGVYLWPDNDPTGDIFLESIDLLTPTVPVFLVPTVPGAKSDPGDVPPEDIERYRRAAVPSWGWLGDLDGYPEGVL